MEISPQAPPERSRPRPSSAAGNQPGFALLVVIVVLLLTSFLASQLIMQVRAELRIALNAKVNAASRFLAEGGVNLALFRLIDTPLEVTDEADEKFFEGRPYTTFLPKGRITYYAVNESGKIDLNRAPRHLLELLFDYYGLDEQQTATVIDSLLDWRDTDDLHRLNGAEREVYEALDDPYVPRNGAIQDPAEFFLVNGTGPLAGKFAASEIFTVYNPQRTINFNSLTPAMLDFLVQGDDEKKKAYQEARDLYGTLNASLARQILGDERYDMLRSYLNYNSSNNRYYFLVATGHSGYTQEDERQERPLGPGARVMALVERRGTRSIYLSWKEGRI